jgi:hypothetical protein
MTPLEVGKMLAFARVYDSRRPPMTPADADAWLQVFISEGIGDSSYADLEAAVIDHYGKSRDWLMPADVVAYCRALRHQRIRELTASGRLEQLVEAEADPDDGPAYHAARTRIVADVAAGRRPVAELEAGR